MTKDWFFNQARLGNIEIVKDFVDTEAMKQYYIYQTVDCPNYYITGPDFNWEFGWRLDLEVNNPRAYKEYRFNQVEQITLEKIRTNLQNQVKALNGQIIERKEVQE